MGNSQDIEKASTPLELAILLQEAAEKGYVSNVELLIKRGADVNKVERTGKSPLFFAIKNGHQEIVNFLISKGANINIIDNSGNTPLSLSIQENRPKITELLLDNGANVNKVGTNGKPPLSWAVCNHNIELIKLLLNHGAKFSLPVALLEAINYRNFALVKFLKEQGASVNGDHGYAPLIKAVEMEHIGIVKYLVEEGANVNQEDSGRTPLSIAAANNDLNTFDYLLKSGADQDVALSELEKYAKHRMDAALYLDQLLENMEGYNRSKDRSELKSDCKGQEAASDS